MRKTAFQYFEIRPVIQDSECCQSFVEESEFIAARDGLLARDASIETFWTIYGIDNDGHATAISDMVEKEDAHAVLWGMLAPLAAARDLLEDGSLDVSTRVERAGALLDDFINQCSNEERI